MGCDGRETPVGGLLDPTYLLNGWDGRVVRPGGLAVGYLGFVATDGSEVAGIGAFARAWGWRLRALVAETSPHGEEWRRLVDRVEAEVVDAVIVPGAGHVADDAAERALRIAEVEVLGAVVCVPPRGGQSATGTR